MHPSQTFSSVEVDVLSIHTHPEFHPANLYNDIAIVKLDGAVDLAANPHISPVCLPDTFQVRGVELKMMSAKFRDKMMTRMVQDLLATSLKTTFCGTSIHLAHF